MKSNKVGTPTTEEELKEEAIRNTVQVESLAKLKESFGKMNRAKRRLLLKGRNHPYFTKKYSWPRAKENARKEYEAELSNNKTNLRS